MDLRKLGTRELTYRRLRVVLEHAPQESAYVKSVGGETALWSLTDHLLATVVDTLAAANWQRGGGKGKRPQPIERPGLEPTEKRKKYGTPMSREELDRRLGRV